MLAKQYRLRKNSEFIATYAQKKYISTLYFNLNTGKHKPFESYITKVAFVVSKKIDKRAVVRNKIKRRMREAYKSLIAEFPNYQFPMSFIFTAKDRTKECEYIQIKEQMKYLLEKAWQKYA